ncbi:MAG TPA: DMT family transporter [Burkholderiales bacterium]|nr:DMT family transporter [Burkholderiales bacterium]
MRLAGGRANATAVVALLAGAAAIGTSALFVKVSEVGPVSSAFWRVFLALPVLWLWARMETRGSRFNEKPGNRKLLVLAGIFFAGDLAVWHWSIVLTSVANATLLANCAPIFVTLAAWLFLHQRPDGLFVAGLVTALSGMVLLLRGDFQHAGTALMGDALGVVTAMFYAAYQLTVTRARQSMSTAQIMATSGAVTAVILLPIALVSEERFIPASTQGWLVLSGLAFFAHAAGQSLIAYAMAHLPATFSSVGLLLQPVIAAALAWMLLGEALSALAIGGAVLVLIGIRIAHAAQKPVSA